MVAAISGVSLTVGLALYLVSLAVVIWAVVDIVRQPPSRMGAGRKVGWVLGSVVGWLLLGVVGGIVALVYLAAVRPRLGRGIGSGRLMR